MASHLGNRGRMILLVKRGGGLFASDDVSAAALAKIKDGAIVECEAKANRSLKFLRKWHVLAQLVWDNVDHEKYPSLDRFKSDLKIMAGHYDTSLLPDGRIKLEAKSVSFSKMKEPAFEKFFSTVCDVVGRVYIHGITEKQLREEVERMIGMRV